VFVPERDIVMETAAPEFPETSAAPVAEPAAPLEAPAAPAAPPTAAEGDATVAAIAALDRWYDTVVRIIREPTGIIEEQHGITETRFNGWRWVFHRFGSLAETLPIACRWYMDNVWSPDTLRTVLSRWLMLAPSALTERERMYVGTYNSHELFRGELSGFLVYTSGGVETYCALEGDTAPKTCTAYQSDAEKLIGAPINRKSDQVGDLFGMLVAKSGNAVFKSVDKLSGKLDGTECANTSNLTNHEPRIRTIQNSIRAQLPDVDPILPLLLDDDETRAIKDNKTRQLIQDAVKKRYDPRLKAADPALDIAHTSHMSVKQACPYMEFLLRWMDMRKLNGKRWFLGLVEAARAGARMT
jgi:hypothetical protein